MNIDHPHHRRPKNAASKSKPAAKPASRPKQKLDLSKLNADQKSAVLHTEGPLLILAGAGSGKTNTMCHRIAYLICEKGVPPSAVLGLSFTNKASTELKERVQHQVGKVLGPKSTSGLVISTFHSLCVRILREFGNRLGYTPQFSILDPSDQQAIVREILKYIKIDEKKFDPSWVLFQIGQAKNKFLSGDEAASFFNSLKGPKVAYDDYSIALQSVFPKYVERLKLQNSMDFDDLLFNAVTLLEQFPDVRETLSRRFRYIMVDEYQDTNPAQFRLLEALTSTHNNICVVGDDDQSIYAWRGADPTHILHFDQYFAGTKKVILNQNYRSTEMILKAANEVIAKNSKRYPKSLWSNRGEGHPIHMVAVEDDRAEATFVVEKIVEKASQDQVDGAAPRYKRFAILYRSNAQSRIFEEQLRLHSVPYKLVGALSFIDRKEVKDLLCYWKLILNPNDDAAARRVVNWPARGVGKTTIQTIHEKAVASHLSFFQAMQEPDLQAGFNERAKNGIGAFLKVVNDLREKLVKIERVFYSETAPAEESFLVAVSETLKQGLESIGVKIALHNEDDDIAKAAKRFENIEALVHAIGLMEKSDSWKTGLDVLQEYVSQLILNAKEEAKDEDEMDQNAITLMTLHGSKGLEFPIVFLVGLEDGCLPHQRTIDEGADLSEERRLFYVGMTRAQDELFLVRAKNRIRYGKPVPRNACRFLEDVPAELLIERDESSTPEFKSKEAEEKHEADVMNFFAEIQKRLGKST
jgi:superfamily I DNA/RNA helicase